jgi:hypothetical protein
MDETLRAKLDEARERMNSKQAGINANRKHDDPAMREWARGKQRPANAERIQFRNSLTMRIEARLKNAYSNLSMTTRHYLPRLPGYWTRVPRLCVAALLPRTEATSEPSP